MSHVYHPSLPSYHEDQVLHDGCPECEERSKDILKFLRVTDRPNLYKTYLRAERWEQGKLDNASRAEIRIFGIFRAFEHILSDLY